MLRFLVRIGAALCLLFLLGGCATLAYYGQAARGQLELLKARRPLDAVLADGATPAAIRGKLELAREARHFASLELGLPDNRSYRGYADIGRDYVVWNVFATPPLGLEPVQSCFPIAGCVDYRGYFSREAALRHADGLRARGYDVYVGGVAAYSTLGWFADPVLNSMLAWDDLRLVKIIFHELAHQLLYVRGDTAFNEGFATAVAEIGWDRFEATRAPASTAERAREAREHELTALLVAYRERLERIYAGPDDEATKQRLKAETFAALDTDFARLRTRWGGTTEYDAWMTQDMNNAKLAAVGTYQDRVPAFTAMLEIADGDLPRFYGIARRVAALDHDARAACLDALTEAPAAPPPCVIAARDGV